ncbi:MAG TPA: FAD:protein FMN transferase [Mobilitalea sp.]|nr:FAD:protein FMN transferase [Mobilitalea sp.]
MDRGFYAFGTMNFIRIDSPLPEKTQLEIIDEMQSKCDALDDLLSAFKPESEIGKINANAGVIPVSISKTTFDLLKRSLYFSEVSKGAFDITIRPAVELWNIGHKEQRVPEKMECKKIKKLVNYNLLILDEKNQTAFLKKKGQSIDLGGIAKGFAGDLIRSELMNLGVKNALINFGGTILTIGNKIDGTPWKVGIQNPTKERGISVGTILLEHDVLVTSGVNERFFIQDGIRYHHILDPRTCEPSRSNVLSVTAAGGSGMDLDGITTALFVLGMEKGVALANQLGLEALYLLETGEIIATKGFAEGKYRFEAKRPTDN